MSNRAWIDPRTLDWTDGLNPNNNPAFAQDKNRYVWESLQEPLMQTLRKAGSRLTVHAAPDSPHATLPGSATYDQTFNPVPFAWLIGFSAHSTQPEGFLVQVTDTVSLETIWSQPVHSANITGNPVYYLSLPRAVLPPSQLAVRIINLSTSPNLCQFCAWFIRE